MNLLITGCCGHIGSYIAENVHKIKKIKKTIIVDNIKSNRFCSLFDLKKNNNLKFFLRNVNNLNSLKDFKKIDYVIHCASMTNAEKSFGKEREMYKNNINCLKTVIEFCKKNKSKLIHLSTTSVYGKQADLVDETCEKKFLKPQSPYANIKLIEENMLKKESKNLIYNTFRFGTIAGISKGIRFHTAVNKFCLNAAINENINVYKTAVNQYRPYLSLKDAFKVFKFFIPTKILNYKLSRPIHHSDVTKALKNIILNSELFNLNEKEQFALKGPSQQTILEIIENKKK